jgi:uncharacterized membrane protein YczE
MLAQIGLPDQSETAVLAGYWLGNGWHDGRVARSRLLRRLVQLYIGLLLYGLSSALLVRARLGLDPWDVFHQGLARHVGLAIGTVVIIVGLLVLLLWIPLRQRPGFGTLSNAVLIGLAMNWFLDVLPAPGPLVWRIAEMAGGVLLCGVATGMYIGADLGPGPRDGLMTGLARRTGRSIRLVRTGIEVTVLAAGWGLGGTFGVGTVVFALTIGPLAQLFLPLFALDGRRHRSLDGGEQGLCDRPDVGAVVAAQRADDLSPRGRPAGLVAGDAGPAWREVRPVSRRPGRRPRAPARWRAGRRPSRTRGGRRRRLAADRPATRR